MKKNLLILAAMFALVSCGGNVQKKTGAADSAVEQSGVPDMHDAEISLDYTGTYKGTLPAADCPGIEVTLTLQPDGKFVLETFYLERSTKPFREEGDYKVTGSLLQLRHEGAEMPERKPEYYKVEENRLRRLNDEKQPVEGPLAEHYLLTKTTE